MGNTQFSAGNPKERGRKNWQTQTLGRFSLS